MRALTGIKPTDAPHIGNLLGMIEPALRLAEQHEAYYFIADYHALTTLHDPERMRAHSREVAATWLALGLDPKKSCLFVQSDVPEVQELTWMLACVTGVGLLERAHAYKAAQDRNKEVNVGVFTYPVLMAADILIYGSNFVPVGKDQKQHVEMARDMAISFNARFGPTLVVPEPLIREEVATIPGLDGQKMSKSYNNAIPVFLPPKELRKKVMSILTDSKGMDEVKDPESCNVFALYRFFASREQQEELAARYRAPGLGYGHAKQALYEAMEARLSAPRERYQQLLDRPEDLENILQEGAARASHLARGTMEKVRDAAGFKATLRVPR